MDISERPNRIGELKEMVVRARKLADQSVGDYEDRALAASAGFGGWLRAGDARAPEVHGAETIDV